MMIFLILAPYGAFAALMLLSSAAVSLFSAAALCLTVIACDAFAGRSIKMLGAGSAIVFLALGCYVALVDPGLSSSAVKLTVDAGMLAIALVSLLIRRPFTLQYAREMVDAETLELPDFRRANYVITWAWSAAFVLMVMANVLMLYLPGLPLWCGIVVAFAARNSALYFTKWYPDYQRAKFATPAASMDAV
jgi:tryptophan-rich sensory protein